MSQNNSPKTEFITSIWNQLDERSQKIIEIMAAQPRATITTEEALAEIQKQVPDFRSFSRT